MARLTKDTSSRGQKPIGDSLIKAPSKTLVIPAKDLVQVIAKVFLLLFKSLKVFPHFCDNIKPSCGFFSFLLFLRNIILGTDDHDNCRLMCGFSYPSFFLNLSSII